ncbi:hypothetical protein [Streptomyces sp. CC219B]|uniref:hypothetical protein n=1 Tax=Streptomyces sp. CC219B TaxID=3044574 RepID=UPI0024A88C56|nr:hypothetical protein [Streptomyces sp. CC219B]
MTGGRRRWRWAVAVWAAVVILGGGLTLWLQDTDEQPVPHGGAETFEPPSVDPDSDCPGPGLTPSPRSDGTIVLCAYSTGR